MAQDPLELVCAVAFVVVGVVVAGVSVVELAELVEAADFVDFVDFVDVELEVVRRADVVVGLTVVGLTVVADVAAVVVVVAEWCEVWVAARSANSATPARDAATTVPVIRRVRRKIASRGEGEGMSSLLATVLGVT
jgi:hypothetical protein